MEIATERGLVLPKALPAPEAVIPVTPEVTKGTCYEDAWRFLMKEEEGELIHGSVTGADGRTVKHAWVELPTGYIWEPETKSFFKKSVFEKTFKPTEDARYTVEEAAIMAAKKGYHGAWAEEAMKAGELENVVDYDRHFSLEELRQMCKERELPISGDKKTLARRLIGG